MKQAESDLAAARTLAQAGYHSQAVWFAAQASEKAHKAILYALGLRYSDDLLKKFSHATETVSNHLPAELQKPAEDLVAEIVVLLRKRGDESRYPKQWAGRPGIVAPAEAMDDSSEDIENADRLVEWCRVRVERAERGVRAMAVPSVADSAAPV